MNEIKPLSPDEYQAVSECLTRVMDEAIALGPYTALAVEKIVAEQRKLAREAFELYGREFEAAHGK